MACSDPSTNCATARLQNDCMLIWRCSQNSFRSLTARRSYQPLTARCPVRQGRPARLGSTRPGRVEDRRAEGSRGSLPSETRWRLMAVASKRCTVSRRALAIFLTRSAMPGSTKMTSWRREARLGAGPASGNCMVALSQSVGDAANHCGLRGIISKAAVIANFRAGRSLIRMGGALKRPRP